MPPKKTTKPPLPSVPIENCLLPSCFQGKCRVNTRRNPNCFCQLGEKFWFSNIKDTYWTSIKDPESERKNESGYVGLKNLGATCYVNTFLQLWFNNKAFRSAIYQWRGSIIEPVEIINEEADLFNSISLDFGERSTDAICGSLQYLFTLLQYSERRYVDPLYFVKCLGLQTDEQQDAQEFSKLFISLLLDSLSAQNERLSNIIHNQFGGSYKYRTQCNICGNISETGSKFYELDLNIKGHHKLTECMKEFLKEEILEGENKYLCPRCQSKQNATRQIILEKLPPVLNIQLLRFVFDRQTGTKKKLNTVINFPNTIDMNEFMQFPNKDDGIYHLSAVLIHCGLSAHSGHYVAHILDREKGEWCRCNDECVTVMKGGKSLNLGKEDDPEVADDEKAKKMKKGDGHNSKNAYMLVYSRDLGEGAVCNVPEDMMNVVSKDNRLFEEWVSHHKIIRDKAIEEGQEKQRFIQRIYPALAVKPGDSSEWIATSWLRQWLNHDTKNVPAIDNTSLMCPHSSADPLKICLMKMVTKPASEELFTRFGGNDRLPGDSLCMICLENNQKKEEFEEKLQEDTKLFNKSTKDPEIGFWVGKKSMKRFKQLARDRYAMNEKTQQNHINEMETDVNNSDVTDNCDSVDNEDEKFTFQLDAVCTEHGNLTVNENARKIVSEEIWNLCLQYFPDAANFPHDGKACELCERKLQNSLEEKKTLKLLAQEQKQTLSFLMDDSVQRMNDILSGGNDSFHIILSTFISQWKKVVRCGGNMEALTADNSDIICEHGLLLYTAEEIIDECMRENPEVFLLTNSEYNILKDSYPVIDEITLSTVSLNDDENTRHFGITPGHCPSCRNERLLCDAEDSNHFSAAPVFISKRVKKDVIEIINDPPDASESKYSIPEEEEESKKYKGKEEDTKSYSMSAKRLNLQEGEIRRSNRKRVKRGEYMLQVSSHQSLKDLKIQILSLYSVLPIEQTLSLDSGQELHGDDRYLIDLGISPGCHIILTVDEPNKQFLTSSDSCDKPRVTEAGFKGTNLLCGSQSS